MTESTNLLTATQAAARLGVKTATLYAYVSRGLLPRHRSPDGRTSLFDAVDVGRLAKRGGRRRSAPSDVTVASELTLVDAGGVWFRGVDALRMCRQRSFEEIAWFLWTGSFDRAGAWLSDSRSQTAGEQAQATLKRGTSPADRLPLIAAAVALTHSSRSTSTDTAAPSDVMASLVDCLPGPSADGARFAVRLGAKLGIRATSMLEMLDGALSLTCEHGLTHAALVARLTIAAGGGVASAVASAMSAASARSRSIAAMESAIARTADEGPIRAADALDTQTIATAFRSGDPRAAVLLGMLADAAPDRAAVVSSLAQELEKRGAGPPTASYAIAGFAWASGISPGSGAAISLVAQAAGWIAHALEELRRPTPYRPRLAYTGPRPRESTPRRTLDAVTDYLSRE